MKTMSLPAQVESAQPFVPGFDADTVIASAVARQFFAQGYKFCARYLSLADESASDLSPGEALDILNSGLALMAVQHVREAGWLPNGTLGGQDGQNVVVNALGVGFPPGVTIWCDLEGVASTATAQDVIDHCTAWFNAVNSAGFLPGLYVGANAILTGQQLYDLPFQHYWRSQSEVPDIPVRGYQLLQFFPSTTANGIGIDLDIVQTDREGGQAQWLRISPLT